MDYLAWKDRARCLAYQYRRQAHLVLDTLVGMRVFLAPHLEYLEGESGRFYPIAIYHEDGRVESAV